MDEDDDDTLIDERLPRMALSTETYRFVDENTYNAAAARAEAAEAENTENKRLLSILQIASNVLVEKGGDNYYATEDTIHALAVDNIEAVRWVFELQSIIAALRTRVAELEAGQGWRPVTEPPENGQEVQIVLDAWWFERNDEFRAGWYFTDDGDYHAPSFPVLWRPAPPKE